MKKMKIPFSPPDISEEEIAEVVDTLKSGWITTGPKTKLLEQEIAKYCNQARAVCLNSATACMEMTLRILGIGEGDEVITSAYTYSASASVIHHVGAKIILVDTQKDSYEMDYVQLENAITAKTKAIIPVDLAGVVCDYEKIMEIVAKKCDLFQSKNEIHQKIGRIAVIADAAHTFGASRNGKMCGELADFTAFSFHAVKNLTTAEGGAVVWKSVNGIDNNDIYQKYMLLSLHGQSKDALAKSQIGQWEYDIVAPYYKCNMTDILASLGLVQLRRYEKMQQHRKEIIEQYDAGLKSLKISSLKHYTKDSQSSGHLYLIRLIGKTREECNDIICQLAEAGISTNVHYKPLPLLSAYKDLGFDIQDYPNAYHLYENAITLPLHTKLTNEEINYIIEILKKIVGTGSEEHENLE